MVSPEFTLGSDPEFIQLVSPEYKYFLISVCRNCYFTITFFCFFYMACSIYSVNPHYFNATQTCRYIYSPALAIAIHFAKPCLNWQVGTVILYTLGGAFDNISACLSFIFDLCKISFGYPIYVPPAYLLKSLHICICTF